MSPAAFTLRSPLRALAGPALVAATLGMAACAPPTPDASALGWQTAASPKALDVERALYRHTVHFATDSANISQDERIRLQTFLQHADPGLRDTIRIEGHADERASDAYNLDLASRRVQSVRRSIDALGFGDRPFQEAAFGEQVPSESESTPEAWRANRRVELVVERSLVVLPPCPDWSRESGIDFANGPHSNYGCATQTNLGLMIAEPRDLVRGRSLDAADGEVSAAAIERYRADEVKELQVEGLE